jgi:hypothetical protein
LEQDQKPTLESELFYRRVLAGQSLLVRRFPESIPQQVRLARFQLSLANCPGVRVDRTVRNRLIGKATTGLVRLPESVRSQPEVLSMLRETNPLMD